MQLGSGPRCPSSPFQDTGATGRSLLNHFFLYVGFYHNSGRMIGVCDKEPGDVVATCTGSSVVCYTASELARRLVGRSCCSFCTCFFFCFQHPGFTFGDKTSELATGLCKLCSLFYVFLVDKNRDRWLEQTQWRPSLVALPPQPAVMVTGC